MCKRSFPFFEKKAEAVLCRYITEINDDEQVKQCICDIAELLYASETKKPPEGISSESTGDISVTYASRQEMTASLKKAIRTVIYDRLQNSGLLYRGG